MPSIKPFPICTESHFGKQSSFFSNKFVRQRPKLYKRGHALPAGKNKRDSKNIVKFPPMPVYGKSLSDCSNSVQVLAFSE